MIKRLGYAFDLYYGKSNNKNPYNLDKIIDGQNYDNQRFFDLLLNNGQETYYIDDALGLDSNVVTRFGYATFWPSNTMHDHIKFPVEPKKPKKPVENKILTEKDKIAEKKYLEDLEKYKTDYENYRLSMLMNPNATFHHLRIVYKGGSKHPDYGRVEAYQKAELPKLNILIKSQEELKQEINDLEKKVQNEIKSKK